MSFLKKIFGKKPGGSAIGNLIRGVSSNLTGGVLGTGKNMIPIGQTETVKDLAKKGVVVDPFTGQTFAGQPATVSSDGTVNMTHPLDEVVITAPKQASAPRVGQGDPRTLPQRIGDYLSPILGRATKDVQFGADNRTLWVIGAAALAVVAAVAMRPSYR